MRRILLGAITAALLFTTGCHDNSSSTNTRTPNLDNANTSNVILPTLVYTTSEVITGG